MHHVFYHKDCADGFAAAYAAWKYFQKFKQEVAAGDFEDTQYWPMAYNDPIPTKIDHGDTIYMLDYCVEVDTMLKLLKLAVTIEVLDHHKTSLSKLQYIKEKHPNLTPFYSLQYTHTTEKSGAVLAWERFFPDLELPIIFKHIQDRDLWQWKLPNTKEVSAALRSLPYDFEVWDSYIEEIERFYTFPVGDIQRLGDEDTPNYEDSEEYMNFVNRGAIILEYEKLQIDRYIKTANFLEIGGHKVPMVNTNHMISEVCHELLDIYPDNPFVACFYVGSGSVTHVSLRGRGDIDVSTVAEVYGGGGHHNAAGFEIKGMLDDGL